LPSAVGLFVFASTKSNKSGAICSYTAEGAKVSSANVVVTGISVMRVCWCEGYFNWSVLSLWLTPVKQSDLLVLISRWTP